MTLDEYIGADGVGLARLIRAGCVSRDEVLAAAFAMVDRWRGLGALALDLRDRVRSRASRVTSTGDFAGVPILLKDYAAGQAGLPLTAGSRLFAGLRVARNSSIVDDYERAGFVVIGRTTTPEFGLNLTCDSALFGPTLNPWDLDRSSGGSSGGAAAAVAAGVTPVAHATDGAGSIRVPAAWCGVFGLKPSRARVSFAPFDGIPWGGAATQHVITRSVRDSAHVLDATAAPPDEGRTWASAVRRPFGRLRIAVSTRAPLGTPIEASWVDATLKAAQICAGLGHHVEEVQPFFDAAAIQEALETIFIAGTAAEIRGRCRATARRLDMTVLEPATCDLLHRSATLDIGAVASAQERLACAVRPVLAFFDRHDVWLTPAVAHGPPTVADSRHDEHRHIADRLASMWRTSPFAHVFNASGQPAASIPMGLSPGGLPVATQAAGRLGAEATLLALAAQIEEVQPWPGPSRLQHLAQPRSG